MLWLAWLLCAQCRPVTAPQTGDVSLVQHPVCEIVTAVAATAGTSMCKPAGRDWLIIAYDPTLTLDSGASGSSGLLAGETPLQ
jgi:hypothetical protein